MERWNRSYIAFASSLAILVIAAVGGARLVDPVATFACGDAQLTEAQLARRFGVTRNLLRRSLETGVTYEDLCTMPANSRAKTFRKLDHPKPDHPGEAVEFRNLIQRGEDGTIPEGALLRAKAQLDQLRASSDFVAPGAGISTGSWTALGPGNIGGRIRSILVHPTTPTTMFVGSVAGGIWRTTNGGASWAPVNDFMANLAVSTMVAQPGSNFSVLYAGTGEGFYNADGIRGAGIFKSVNGGTTWTQLAATNNSNFLSVNRLAFSPNGAILLAATFSGLYRSTDGGASFSPVLTNVSSYPSILDVDFDPSDSNRAVASGHDGKAWYSTNGGQSFTPSAGLPVAASTFRRVEVAYAPSSPNIVYASVDASNGTVYRSTDGGANYSEVYTVQPYLMSQGWYDNVIWVDPTNPNVVIVGGVDLWRSTDGAASFIKISQWQSAPVSAHADHHAIVAAPGFNGTSNTTVYFGNDGGIYRADNVYTVSNTSGWQELNNQLAITQFYGAGADPASGKVFGGTQDNGTLVYTTAGGSEAWVSPFGGDGGFSAVDQTNPAYCYGEYVYLQIHRTTNCGVSGSAYIDAGISDAGSGMTANFIAPFILDPNDQARLLGGGLRLWRTDNARAATPAWTDIKAATGAAISAIAVQRGDSGHIWVGHNDGGLYKTINGTALTPTWTLADTGLPNKLVTRIAIDPTNPLVVYVTFGGYQTNNIWKSINGGTSWTNIHGSLPAAPIRSIVLHPANPNWLYLGTELGVFTSETGGASWFMPQDGPANVSVDEVFIAGSMLYAATHGRGVFRSPIDAGPPPAATLISPSGYAGTQSPTFRWNAAPRATWYQLRVDDTTGSRVLQWFTSEQAGCVSGGVCQGTPSVTLTAGAASWRVQTWSPDGYGPWSATMAFNTGLPTTQILETYPVPNTQAGFSAPLWVHVRNTGTLALPAGSQAWFWVTGPGGYQNWAGNADVSGLAAGASRWALVDWEVPITRTGGVHNYTGRVWSTQFNGWIGDVSAPRAFNITAAPAQAARIVETYQVTGSSPGATVRLWARVRNVGTSALTARVWFNVYTVGWVGFANVSLASGAQQWYYYDWTIPASRPTGAHWYQAQAWNMAGSTTISPLSAWQAFTVGFAAADRGGTSATLSSQDRVTAAFRPAADTRVRSWIDFPTIQGYGSSSPSRASTAGLENVISRPSRPIEALATRAGSGRVSSSGAPSRGLR